MNANNRYFEAEIEALSEDTENRERDSNAIRRTVPPRNRMTTV